jgi:uncharacterized damage-inducible protein DinB
MRDFLRDLFAHQAWADSQHWLAIEAHEGALDDAELRQRLHHIHLVQRAFLGVARGTGRPERPRLEDYASMAELKADARAYHADAAAFLEAATDARLAEATLIPWFEDPPCRISLGEALTQAAMHSHYHRGQNASRLRALGGAPPLTDLIVWYWKGRPAPSWP